MIITRSVFLDQAPERIVFKIPVTRYWSNVVRLITLVSSSFVLVILGRLKLPACGLENYLAGFMLSKVSNNSRGWTGLFWG